MLFLLQDIAGAGDTFAVALIALLLLVACRSSMELKWMQRANFAWNTRVRVGCPIGVDRLAKKQVG